MHIEGDKFPTRLRCSGVQNTPFTNFGRRSFLSRLGRTGILTASGLTVAEILRQPEAMRFFDDSLEAFSRKSRETVQDLERIAQPRMEARNITPAPLSGEDGYGTFLEALELKHISKQEVFSAHRRCRNGVHNSLPPESMWCRIAPTLKLADELRSRLGVKLTYIASAYRCPDYNSQCPGAAKYSQHMQNRALDLVFDCPPGDAFAEARKMRAEGKFQGGLGLYPSFIHLDTRGHNATWGI